MGLGLVLFAAGIFKLGEGLAETQKDDLATALLLLVAEAEFLGGLWMMAGYYPEQTRPWSAVYFAGLWAASLYAILTGKCSCNCFGGLALNPWYSLLFDLFAVVLLLRLKPKSIGDQVDKQSTSDLLPIGLGIAMLLVGLAGIWQESLVSVSGIASLNGVPLKYIDIDIIQYSIQENTKESTHIRLRTDTNGILCFPPLRPGHYAVSLSGRVSLLDSHNTQRDTNPISKNMRKGKISKQSQREIAETNRRASDSETVWLEINGCSDRSITIDFK